MNLANLFTEDEIIIVGEDLKNLKGKTLMDNNNQFFTLKDYDIKSTSYKEWNIFKPNEEVTVFYIDFITLTGAEEDYVHKDDDMCSHRGVRTLLEYRVNFRTLEKNLNKFTLKNGIQMNFGQLTVTANKSSNFKRR